MAWLLVTGNRDLRLMLDNFRLPFTEMTVTHPHRIQGLAFPEEEEARICEMLGIDPTKRRMEPTNFKGVFYVRYNDWPPKKAKGAADLHADAGTVRAIVGTNLEAWGEILPVLEEWAEEHGVYVTVDNPHGHLIDQDRELEEGRVHVAFYTAFGNPEMSKAALGARYGEAFGEGLQAGQRDGVFMQGIGRVIHDDPGNAVAEVYRNIIAIPYDLPHVAEGINAARLMQRTLEACEPALDLTCYSREEVAAAKAKNEEEVLSKSRDAYVKAVMKRLDARRAEDEKAQHLLVEQLEGYSKQIVEATRKHAEVSARLAFSKEVGSEYEKRAGEEFDKLKTLPHVTRVLVARDIISVFTDTIYLECEKQTYEIGDFRIDMHLNGSLTISNLRVKELTGQTQFHHPHVFSYEKPMVGDNVCLGNIREGVMKLIGQYEYAVAAQILIEFLHTVTKTGSYVSYLKRYWEPMEAKKEDDDGEAATKTAESKRAKVA